MWQVVASYLGTQVHLRGRGLGTRLGKPISSFQLLSVVRGHHVYKTVWTRATCDYKLRIYRMRLINGCGRRLKTMRLTVKYTLNNEVRLTTCVYGILYMCMYMSMYTMYTMYIMYTMYTMYILYMSCKFCTCTCNVNVHVHVHVQIHTCICTDL